MVVHIDDFSYTRGYDIRQYTMTYHNYKNRTT